MEKYIPSIKITFRGRRQPIKWYCKSDAKMMETEKLFGLPNELSNELYLYVNKNQILFII